MTSSLSLPCISIYFWSQHLKKHGLKAALLHCCHGHNFTTDVKNVSIAEVGGEKRTVRYVGWVRGGGIPCNHGTPQCHPSSKKSGLAKALLSDHGDKKSPWMNFVSKGFYVLEPENTPSWKRRNILQNTNFVGSMLISEIVLDKTNNHGNLRVTLLPMPPKKMPALLRDD